MASEKNAYVEKMKARLDELRAEINKLGPKADKAKADVRTKYEKEIEDFRRKRKDLARKLKEIENASDSAWRDLKKGLENSFETLKKSFAQAREKL
jgi:predicted  nucleic acid-binding Zn-ribbon protein